MLVIVFVVYLLSRSQIKKDDLISEIIPYYTLYIYLSFI